MKDNKKCRNILIFGHNYIGDTLALTPAIHALKRKFPEGMLTVVVSKNASYVLRRNSDVWKIVETGKLNGIKGIIGIFKLFSELKKIKKNNRYKFYACINFLTSFKFAVLGFLLSERQIGWDKFFNNFFLSYKIKLKIKPKEHLRLNNIDKSIKLIEPFYINAEEKYFDRSYIYEVLEGDVKKAKNLLHNSFNGQDISESIDKENFKFVVFSPGSTRKTKEANPVLYSLFADYLNKNGYYVVITGGKEDKLISKNIYDKIENKHMSADLSGLTDIYTLGGLIYLATLAVCVDNGALHLSSAIGTFAIGLFGSTDPAVCAPLSDKVYIIDKRCGCFYCFSKNCPKESFRVNGFPECMDCITVDDLIQAFAKIDKNKKISIIN